MPVASTSPRPTIHSFGWATRFQSPENDVRYVYERGRRCGPRSPAPDLFYDFDVPNGGYIVNLYVANTYDGTSEVGERVFDIFAEGQLVYDDFDQIVAAGASARVVVRAMRVDVVDGNGLSLHLERVTQSPALKGIEVRRQGP